MRDKKKFINYIDASEYVSVAGTETNEDDEYLVKVVFHDNATFEITQFVCEKAEEFDFYVHGIMWEGGAIFKNDGNSLFSL